jgi:hypothetical protein
MLTNDPWMGVPSQQRRRHWEIFRRLVLEPGSGDIRTIFRRLRRIRRAAGWRLDWATKNAAACSDVLALLYALLEFFDPQRHAVVGATEGC